VISESPSSPVTLDELSERITALAQIPIVAIARGGEAPSALIDLIG